MPSEFQNPFPSHSPSSPPCTKRLSIHALVSVSDLTILNPYLTLPPLHAHLRSLDLTNPERLRPSWDTYFMHLSDLAARRSNCMKRRVGCIIVKDQRVIAMGYNGTPKGMCNCNAGGCKRCNEGAPCGTRRDQCLCIHAEENALLEAGKERVTSGSGAILYCNTWVDRLLLLLLLLLMLLLFLLLLYGQDCFHLVKDARERTR